ncbi:protein eyes shut homolog [Anguilla anguilla]|uniref:protein eyes shut homolog n=1 Tax=Anguilla anguilla TaxID=7936 RepID=UPI0015AA8E96|nr:protein eyes shut homolog [Anguilla anguilla]
MACSCECQAGFAGPNCEDDVDECASSPCRNRGICQDLANRFRCICPLGHFGALCDLDVDECEASSCLHGGTCVSTRGGVRCTCPPGYTGDRCESDVDECASDPCQNGGECADGPDRYRCACPPGLSGLHCETDARECASSPCLHGSCLDGADGYTCECEPGWSGYRCETNINECDSSPCMNGATCVDRVDRFACFCPEGFLGKRCQVDVDVDVCLQAPRGLPLCFNGGTCQDGPGANFTCRCPAGFSGERCELEVNECRSEPCLHGAVCHDLVNGYRCLCQPGWTGLQCEDDINECLPEPCSHGLCFQNVPGRGYTCFCRPGFVGKNCEQNYDDCLLRPCPEAHTCIDGINNVSCVPTVTSVRAAPGTTPPPRGPLSPASAPASAAWPTGSPEEAAPPTDFGYAWYSGDSYMEFEGIDPGAVGNVSVRFRSRAPEGTVLYADPGPGGGNGFFARLFVARGVLQYEFACNQGGRTQRINTTIQVDSGDEHMVHIRQSSSPCGAEVTVSGYGRAQSTFSLDWSGLTVQRTGRVFIGGLPLNYPTPRGDQQFYNFTGCIEIMEMNKMGRFYMSKAIGGSNVEKCRRPGLSETPTASHLERVDGTATPPPDPPSGPPPAEACRDEPCRNGGTCRPRRSPSGAASFGCDCPLHFTGPLCDQDTAVFFPSFDGTSYLEMPFLTSLLGTEGNGSALPPPEAGYVVTLYLTVKSNASLGSILYTREEDVGDRFLHLFLENGRPVVELGCGGANVLTVKAGQSVGWERLTPVMIRYRLPESEEGGHCGIEMVVDDGPANRRYKKLTRPMTQVRFGPLFLGGVPSHAELPEGAGPEAGFQGCVRELQVNSRELFIVDEAVRGKNIGNCNAPVCQRNPCQNGGTCISDAESWFCRCPGPFSGRLCQFRTCQGSPCAHGGTCVPRPGQEAVCLCPYGRAGILCEEAVDITRPSFNGTDEFGFTSFMAYPSLPGVSLFYEFQVKLTFSSEDSALRDNLILYSGQKGQGINGDDFLVLGVRSGRIVHRFNLGSGVRTIVSDRIVRGTGVHTVRFGRSLRTGWLKVDDQKNKTGSSPGQLVGLNVFSQLYVGGYREYTPELLPWGARFQNGFQGCIFDLRFRARGGGRFRAPGRPEEHPNSGRSVGQCGVTPCALVQCQNGGTCVDSGSTVYCRCALGWKGALCSETVSVCDAEHSPPPLCARGSTCVPLPRGYTCRCPLGTAGEYCQEALAISDPSFSANRSSWMSFSGIEGLRHRTDLRLQFRSLSPEGILFYAAQRLSAQAGDFFCVCLASGFAELRYDLGDAAVTVRSASRVDASGGAWHTLRAGRDGRRGYLSLDGAEARGGASPGGMAALDVGPDVFVGGVPSLDAVAGGAVGGGERAGFTGCVREAVLNGRRLELSEGGASGGAGVGDCDGTACGHGACGHGGTCVPLGPPRDGFACSCPPPWTGPGCELHAACAGQPCRNGGLCHPDAAGASYACACPLGWQGGRCDRRVTLETARFAGRSYLRYSDPAHGGRDLTRVRVTFSFSAGEPDGLMLWAGPARAHGGDHLAVGLRGGRLTVAVGLGEGATPPITHRATAVCCHRWHVVTLDQNRTVVQVSLDGERVVFRDLDPFERYVQVDHGGVFYFGGFEPDRDVETATDGLFDRGFVGEIKDVFLYRDTSKVEFLQNSEGFNVYTGDE